MAHEIMIDCPPRIERIFLALNTERLAMEIRKARRRVVLAAPGIHLLVAEALQETLDRLGHDAITIVVDCDDEVCRMGYGDIAAFKLLNQTGLTIGQSPGLRVGVLICDDRGWAFAPAVLCLEDETNQDDRPNGVSLTPEQAEAIVGALNPKPSPLSDDLPQPEIGNRPLSEIDIKRTEKGLEERPPQKFDVARTIRVYQSYFHYVEAHLEGLAINRRQVRLPKCLLNLQEDKELEARLRTTFNLIEKGSAISQQAIDKKLADLLKNMAPSLGKPWGRVILRAFRGEFDRRIAEIKEEVARHQEKIEKEIEQLINNSIARIAKVFAGHIAQTTPEGFRYRFHGEITEKLAEDWLKNELAKDFPKPDAIIKKMKLIVHFRDVTYEDLRSPEFIKVLKKEFPRIVWPYVEFEVAKAKDQP